MQFNNNKTIWRHAVSITMGSLLLVGCGSDSSDDSDTDTPPDVREVSQGMVQGVEEGYGYSFKGIPYAKPPVGDLRFAPPEPGDAWEGTLDASAFGTSCPQSGSAFNGFVNSVDEDCLFLNVYTPAGADGTNPVMVWIHGGAFITGSGGSSYEPSRLVEQGVVVVTMNYRLGVLGFLPSSDLPEGNGQFGLLDQQLALRWVQDNIAEFGGNAGNVTIFGESAGGHSVLSQLVSAGAGTGSEGLFHKAIVQSGAYQPTQIPQAFAESLVGAPVIAALGCDTASDVAACLRDENLTGQDFLTAQGDLWFNPTWGQGMLPHSIEAALKQQGGASFPQGVPVLTGNNLNEGRLFLALDEIPLIMMDPPAPNPVDTQAEYDAEVAELLATDPRGLDAQQIGDDYLAMYDMTSEDRYTLALAAIQTSWRFACNQLDQVASLSAQGVDTYGYWFTDQDAPSLFGPQLTPALSFDLGAAHALEIQYVLNSEATMLERGATEAQIDLSEQMIDYWVQFARNGNPSSSDGTVTWPSYGNGNQLMELNPAALGNDALVDVAAANQAHSCDYWANPPLQAAN